MPSPQLIVAVKSDAEASGLSLPNPPTTVVNGWSTGWVMPIDPGAESAAVETVTGHGDRRRAPAGDRGVADRDGSPSSSPPSRRYESRRSSNLEAAAGPVKSRFPLGDVAVAPVDRGEEVGRAAGLRSVKPATVPVNDWPSVAVDIRRRQDGSDRRVGHDGRALGDGRAAAHGVDRHRDRERAEARVGVVGRDLVGRAARRGPDHGDVGAA